MKIFRRTLLILGGFAVAGFLVFRWWQALKHLLYRPSSEITPQASFSHPYKQRDKTLISVVGGQDPHSMVELAVDMLGGWGKIGVKGSRILVKPNVVAGEGPPTTTSARLVGAVVKSLYGSGASQVLVGDMSALMTLPTRKNMQKTQIESTAREAGAKVIYFEEHSWREIPVKQARYLDSVYVSEWMYKVDLVVNLPVVKTHRSAVYSIALKNFVGATHGRQRPYVVDSEHWEEVVAELNLAYAPNLNIVDATTIMVSGGPWHGESRSPNLILACGDRIVSDLAGLALIKHYQLWPQVAESSLWSQRQIQRAVELGLGVSSARQIRLDAENLEKDKQEFSGLIGQIKSYMKII